ncbi:hypothetical protein [Rubellimicrobium aerolatum]|uniref:Uncharacterized protein n=1 Tax=Rubellimicrobium aerolatum TaxID=490979 RepID=A0ABW0SB25_9RHOB|nr:hypothetical protein [Rubellimicrobium aerolatum]MBP1805450.1 hypothetical protein [Rubellimicrobium aerolatum]
MMNKDNITVEAEDTFPAAWRSVGTVAALLAARAEAERGQRNHHEVPGFVPVAWAAE